jgi:hypothetical protein
VAAVAAVVDAAAVDSVSSRGCLQVVDSGKIAPAMAAVAWRPQIQHSFLTVSVSKKKGQLPG